MSKVLVQIDPGAQKVVPVEPDETMYSQVENQRLAQAYWRKLLSAAPTVPHLEGEDEAVAKVVDDYGFNGSIVEWLTFNKEALPIGTKLYTRPQPIGEIEARALEEAAKKVSVLHESNKWVSIEAAGEVCDLLRQLAAQKRAAAGEGK